MKDVFRLMRRDLRRATSNVMALIVIFGLVIIPSLFTWFNVIASWDPFSNTGNLKVAVANTDAGYTSELMPIPINVGDQVVAALRENDQLDWVITSEDDAIDGTKSGEYYAALVLPHSFSTDMLTFFADGGKVADIAYYTNEKKNALAPTITGQGAEGLSTKISETFSETLGNIAFGLVSSMSQYLDDADAKAALTRLEAKVSEVSGQLRAGAQTADMFTALVQSTIPLVDSASALMAGTHDALSDAGNAAGGAISSAQVLKTTLGSATDAFSTAIEQTLSGYDAVADSIDELFSNADQTSSSQVAVLDTLAQRVDQQIASYTDVQTTLKDTVGPLLPEAAQPALEKVLGRLDQIISRQESVRDRLREASEDVVSGNASIQSTHQAITQSLNEAKTALTSAGDSYQQDLKPQLEALSNTLTSIENDVSTVKADLSTALAGLTGSSDGISSALTQTQQATQSISQTLNSTADTFDRISQTLASAADGGDLQALADIVGTDPHTFAASLAQPIALDRIAVFPTVSFGAGMAPLYTTLSLWVGALLMTVAIKAGVGKNPLPGKTDLSPTQKYLGRYGIFALLGLAQSGLVMLGLILFIGVQPAHPFLLLVAGMVTSLVFTLLIYTFVVAFGNAGKALAVLLLVIQISGAGGAYPLQLLPQWFQSISPFLPATHAIDAMRAATAGIYQGDYWISLGLLLLFVVPTLILGLVLRRPLIRFNHNLVEAVESTKLM